jgi:hypothetical protein
MATSAAEMIDRLFMLHIRRFGFRIITYLESYTMFVASTINILDLKEGIDTEGASARLALSLEVLRNASSNTGCVTSTPSNARCVEIIEQLLRKNGKAKEEDRPKRSRKSPGSLVGSQGAGADAVGAHQRPYQSPSTATAHQPQSLQAHAPPPSTVSLPSTMTHTTRVTDFQFLNIPDISGMRDWPPFFDDESTPPELTPMQGAKAVETPLRWLADNVDSDHPWLRMDMDFVQDFEAHMDGVAEGLGRD